MSYQYLHIRDQGDVAIVQILATRIAGILETEQVGRELYDVLDGNNYNQLVLDFSSVDFISSAMFGKLIHLNSKIKSRGGTLTLCGIRPDVREVFHICGLDRIFNIRQDESDALPPF
jgi:anti-anti-sigma factor